MTLRALVLTDSDSGRRFCASASPFFGLITDAAGSDDLLTDDSSRVRRLHVAVTADGMAA